MKTKDLKSKISKIWKSKTMFKTKFDKYADPLMWRIGTNGAYLWGGNQALEFINDNLDTSKGLATLGTYIALGTGLWYFNKHIVNPVANKIKHKYQVKENKRMKTPTSSWVGTTAKAGLLVGAYLLSNFGDVLNLYKSDIHAVSNVFSDNNRVNDEIIIVPESQSDSKIDDNTTINDLKKQISQKIDDFANSSNYSKKTAIIQNKMKSYEMENLRGRKFGFKTDDKLKLFAYYICEGQMDSIENINPVKNMKDMWDRKISRDGGCSDPARDLGKTNFNKYTKYEANLMSIDDYILEADKTIKEVNENLNWSKLKGISGLNTDLERNLLKKIATSFTGKDLIAYSLTELMPGRDGQLNLNTMDFMLKNFGREYVELIPAQSDKYLSFGPYQFTSYAIKDVEGQNKGGVTEINYNLPEKLRIGGSVATLEDNDHHKAAYMFVIYNLGRLISSLNRADFTQLNNHIDDYLIHHKDDFVKYTATAHNNPNHALKAGKNWIKGKLKSDYTDECSSQIKEYSIKTNNNFKALYNGNSVLKNLVKAGELEVRKIDDDTKEYIIQRGDNLSKIVSKYNQKYDPDITISDITGNNGKKLNPKKLQPGQKVYIHTK